MSYELIVRFERDYHDDANVIGKEQPTAVELATQLAKELQTAYDEIGLAGQFKVEKVLLNGIEYPTD